MNSNVKDTWAKVDKSEEAYFSQVDEEEESPGENTLDKNSPTQELLLPKPPSVGLVDYPDEEDDFVTKKHTTKPIKILFNLNSASKSIKVEQGKDSSLETGKDPDVENKMSSSTTGNANQKSIDSSDSSIPHKLLQPLEFVRSTLDQGPGDHKVKRLKSE